MAERFETDVESVSSGELLHPSNVMAIGRDTIRKSGLLITPSQEPNQLDILREIEPVVADELNRHNAIREPWVPESFFPIDDDGRIIGRSTDPEQQPLLSPTAQSAMLVNLLTEDNLPSYHRVIAENFGLEGPWGTWVHQWTAEEDNHAYAMRAFLDLTRAIDPATNEQERMTQMKQGYMVEKSPLNTLAYVTFQELATRVSHRQTGKATNNELADDMLARIAKDENLHMIFYRNLANAALDVAPNQMMRAITDELKGFVMPGSNIADFQVRALEIAEAGIYDPRRHLSEVVKPVLRQWRVFEREYTGDGAVARDELAAYLEKLEKDADRFDDRRDNGSLARTIEILRSRQK